MLSEHLAWHIPNALWRSLSKQSNPIELMVYETTENQNSEKSIEVVFPWQVPTPMKMSIPLSMIAWVSYSSPTPAS